MTTFSTDEIGRMQEEATQLGRGPELERTLLTLIAEVDARQAEEALERQRRDHEAER